MDASLRDAATRKLDRTAIRFVILIGLVSLFGDMTYEGARSIVGPYLGALGTSATVVGIAAGFGELIGYAFRLLSGYIGDRTGRYWTVTIIGYVINLLAVPILALAGSWQVAVVLIVAERMGRALRTPTRDAMLSHAASRIGGGWAFGLHEALDTAGAIIGPLAVAAALWFEQGYARSFAMLAIPAAISIAILLFARSQFPAPEHLEVIQPIREPKTLPRKYWWFTAAAACIGAGYADFSLLAYHFGKTAVVAVPWVPLLYALAMSAAAVAALGLGRWFDQAGLIVLVPATLISALSAPLAFLGGPAVLAIGVVCWGIGMGAQESVMRAVIGSMAPRSRRGTAFGLFHTVFGIAWFAGSTILGILYDHSVVAVAAFSGVVQLLALPLLWFVARKEPCREFAKRSDPQAGTEVLMRSLTRRSFFRTFDLLLSTSNPGAKLSEWVHDGVTFTRDRHTYTGPRHGITLDIVTLTCPGRRGWSLIVTKEYWWMGAQSKPFKDLRWARAVSGDRAQMMSWLQAQESGLERSLSIPASTADRREPAARSGVKEKIGIPG